LGIFPLSAASNWSPLGQWNFELATVAPFFVFVGKVSLVENVNLVEEPFAQWIVVVPVSDAGKVKVAVPGALGDGEHPLSAGEPGPDVIVKFPERCVQVPLTAFGFDVAEAAPGIRMVTASIGMASAETNVTT
jgi:hypothetical protein